MLPVFLGARGARVSEILYNSDLSFPSEKVIDSIDRNTALVVLINPGNPTGTLIAERDLEQILERSSEVLLDETYWHFAGKSYAGLVESYDNLFIAQNFSKVYGLSGMRVGFVISGKRSADELRKVALPYPISSLSARAAEAALRDKDFAERVVERTQAEKRYLIRALRPFCEVKDTHTNFLLARFGGDCGRVLRALGSRGVLLRDMSSYPLLSGYLRISVGRRRDNRALVSALRETGVSLSG
jgi:histidinol-phosphate aminotransferase